MAKPQNPEAEDHKTASLDFSAGPYDPKTPEPNPWPMFRASAGAFASIFTAFPTLEVPRASATSVRRQAVCTGFYSTSWALDVDPRKPRGAVCTGLYGTPILHVPFILLADPGVPRPGSKTPFRLPRPPACAESIGHAGVFGTCPKNSNPRDVTTLKPQNSPNLILGPQQLEQNYTKEPPKWYRQLFRPL